MYFRNYPLSHWSFHFQYFVTQFSVDWLNFPISEKNEKIAYCALYSTRVHSPWVCIPLGAGSHSPSLLFPTSERWQCITYSKKHLMACRRLKNVAPWPPIFQTHFSLNSVMWSYVTWLRANVVMNYIFLGIVLQFWESCDLLSVFLA